MNVFCLLFAGNYMDKEVQGLSNRRTIASLPIGGRYRLVDFILSSLVKASVPNIGIVTRKNYTSLTDHLGWGKDWDLDRKHGGLKVLTPLASSRDLGGNLRTKFEALASVESYIDSMLQDYCIIADANYIGNIDFKDVLNQHIKNNADITVLYKRKKIFANETEIVFDENKRVYESLYHAKEEDKMADELLKIYVLNKKLLKRVVAKGMTLGWEDLARDYISKNFNRLNVYAYEVKGYFRVVNSLDAYYRASMELLDHEIREELFLGSTDVLTKIRDSVPTFYGKNAKVKNSVLADGSNINGRVENSILFRNVTIEEGAVVKNCILFEGTVVEKGAELDYVVTDKNVKVREDKTLKGEANCPFVVPKNKEV